MRSVFSGVVRGGKFVPDDPPRFQAQLARLEGRRVHATFKREPSRRTLDQNAYYWGLVVPTIAEWSGHDDEEIHEAMKELFLRPRSVDFPGTETAAVSVSASTAALTIEEFSAYVDRIVRWAGDQGLHVPVAGEV